MHSLLRRRPSHAAVVAYLALFVALGGTSYEQVAASPERQLRELGRQLDDAG